MAPDRPRPARPSKTAPPFPRRSTSKTAPPPGERTARETQRWPPESPYSVPGMGTSGIIGPSVSRVNTRYLIQELPSRPAAQSRVGVPDDEVSFRCAATNRRDGA